MIWLIYILIVLMTSTLAAQWAHDHLGKNYWEVFVISAVITPLFLSMPYYRYLKSRRSASSK